MRTVKIFGGSWEEFYSNCQLIYNEFPIEADLNIYLYRDISFRIKYN